MNDEIDDNIEYHIKHRQTIEAIAKALPPSVVKQALGHIPRAQQALLFKECPSLSELAHAALFTNLLLESRDRVDRLMECHPDPATIAGYVEFLSIPGALGPKAHEYISKLIQLAFYLQKLKVGLRDTLESEQYIPDPPQGHRIRTLIVGEQHPREKDVAMAPVIKLSELDRFPYLTQLHWYPVDPRIGSVQYVFKHINHRYPTLKYLQLPWSDYLDQTPWQCLPAFHNLKHLTFRFTHDSQINVTEFVKCLRVFYERGMDVQVGSGCAIEIARWLDQMYTEVYNQSITNGWRADEMLRWVIQNNRRYHLLKLTELSPPDMKRAMFEAIRHLNCSDGTGIGMEIDLIYGELPDILKRNLRYLRLQVNALNINANQIPTILQSNPRLASLVVAQHVIHHGGSYDGNCTFNRIPLLPKQDVARHSGQRSTLPGFELKYILRRDSDTGKISQQWRWYPRVRRGQRLVATELTQLNVFDISEADWTDQLRDRLYKWENEVKGWFDMSPRLMSIVKVLNTDRNKFGRLEKYWCTCNEKEYS